MRDISIKKCTSEGECVHFDSRDTAEESESYIQYIPKKNICLKANVVTIVVGIQQRSKRARSQKRIFV